MCSIKKIASIIWICITVLSVTLLTSCTSKKQSDLLDPNKPITIRVWHYYNGTTKESFDTLISEFNETIGMDKGIVVEAQSQGDVNQLATAVYEAASESIGSQPLPEIFASYTDNAFRVNQLRKLVSMDQLFSEEELSQYRQEFLDEGRFATDGEYYVMPIAKSSENLYVNKDFWVKFADEHGFSEKDLKTWESIYSVAEVYYEETGKSFFSIDGNANFFLVASMQLGTELYSYRTDGSAQFNFDKKIAYTIWKYYVVPYLKGYYVKSGRFSSDDAKTGAVIAYTGSTAGAAYFPYVVSTSEKDAFEITPLVLPYPCFEDSHKTAIQQGAGMCVVNTDEAHNYAAKIFLKWFTEMDQNLRFAVSTGYFPVMNEALDEHLMTEEAMLREVPTEAIVASIQATGIMFETYELYNSKSFFGSYEIRKWLDSAVMNDIKIKLNRIDGRVEQGEDRKSVIAEFVSDQSFETWYKTLMNEANTILSTY